MSKIDEERIEVTKKKTSSGAEGQKVRPLEVGDSVRVLEGFCAGKEGVVRVVVDTVLDPEVTRPIAVSDLGMGCFFTWFSPEALERIKETP